MASQDVLATAAQSTHKRPPGECGGGMTPMELLLGRRLNMLQSILITADRLRLQTLQHMLDVLTPVQVPGNRPQTSNLKPRTSNLEPQTSNLKPQT